MQATINQAVELRVTRNRFYGYPGENGNSVADDLSSRNGHYFRGESIRDCMRQALATYPGEFLTFQLWKENGGPSERQGEMVRLPEDMRFW